MYTTFYISSPITTLQSQGILPLRSSAPNDSLNYMLDYFNSLNGGGQIGVGVVSVDVTAATATIKFNGQPNANDTITIFNTTYTAVASGATGTQFNIGASAQITGANFYTLLLATPGFNLYSKVTNNSTSTPTLTLTAQEPGVTPNSFTIVSGLTNVVVTQFTGGTQGTGGVISCGQQAAIPSNPIDGAGTFMKFIYYTETTPAQMLAILNIQTSCPKESFQRLINFNESLLGMRKGFIIARLGVTRAVASMAVTGQPLPTQTLTINGNVYTAVASGATGAQFNIGSTVLDTATNIYNVVHTYTGYPKNYLVVQPSITNIVGTSSCTVNFTVFEPGSFGNAYTISRTLSNTSALSFAGASNGTQTNLTYGVSPSLELPFIY